MDAYLLTRWSTILFGIAAVGGLLMAVIRLRGANRPPSLIAMLHGLLAAAAFTLLITALITVGLPLFGKISLAALTIAAMVGVWLNLRFHVQNLPLPIGPMFLHAGFAVIGVVLLLVCLMQAPAITAGQRPFPS